MSAFAIFFMLHPSFLALQRSLHKNTGKDNTRTLFGMEKILTDNHIRQRIDGIDPDELKEAYFHIFEVIISKPGGKRTYHGSFITSLTPTRENIAKLASCARARWKIENETFQDPLIYSRNKSAQYKKRHCLFWKDTPNHSFNGKNKFPLFTVCGRSCMASMLETL